jgi:OOP family OmpA-OmpF porin
MSVMSVAQAEEFLDSRWYVAPFGSYVLPDGNRGVNDGWAAGLGVGKILNEHFNVELRGFFQQHAGFEKRNNGAVTEGNHWNMAGGTADLQYYLFRGKFSPYAVIGAGAMQNWMPHIDQGVSIIAETGVGASYELMDNLLLRADVRYRYTNDMNGTFASGTNQHNDMVVNAGLVIPFGEKPKPAVKVEEPKQVDCSALDDDHDGVNNCLDKCPDTMAGSKVNADGCPISIELKGVQFKVNSAVLTENAKHILDGVAQDLIAASQGKDIEVQGHTSSEGSNAHNMKLSQQRSQSVVNYLKEHGVKDKLVAKGYGETELKINPDKTEAQRAVNRRVELHWFSN